MTGLNFAHVAAMPPGTLEPELVNKAAAVIGKDPYTARLLLTGKIPKIIANCETIEEAQSAVRDLCALGLVAFSVSDSELYTPFSSNPVANSVAPGKGEAAFIKQSGETQVIHADDVFLILRGTKQTSSEKETTTTEKKLNVAATVILGGIPVYRKVKAKTKEEFQIQGFVRLYTRASPEPAVEILQNEFNYSFLGDTLALSSFENLNSTAAFLRNIFPAAIFDDTLTAYSDGTEVNCRLIYRYYKARGVC